MGQNESAVLMEAQGQALLDPTTRRAQKIARFRMEKAAKAKLDALKVQVWTIIVHHKDAATRILTSAMQCIL